MNTQDEQAKSYVINGVDFRRRLRWLIVFAWGVPAIFVVTYIAAGRMFTMEQMATILMKPIVAVYFAVWLAISIGFLLRPMRVMEAWLDTQSPLTRDDAVEAVAAALRRFPFLFWILYVFAHMSNIYN